MIWTLSDGVSTRRHHGQLVPTAVSFSLLAIACLIWFFYSEDDAGLQAPDHAL